MIELMLPRQVVWQKSLNVVNVHLEDIVHGKLMKLLLLIVKYVTRDTTARMNMILVHGAESLIVMLKWNNRNFVTEIRLDSFVLLGPFVMLVILNPRSVLKTVTVPTLGILPQIHLLVLLDIIVKKLLLFQIHLKSLTQLQLVLDLHVQRAAIAKVANHLFFVPTTNIIHRKVLLKKPNVSIVDLEKNVSLMPIESLKLTVQQVNIVLLVVHHRIKNVQITSSVPKEHQSKKFV